MRHFFFIFSINAEIIVTSQLSIVKFRRYDQLNFIIYHVCHGDGPHIDFFICTFADFQNL